MQAKRNRAQLSAKKAKPSILTYYALGRGPLYKVSPGPKLFCLLLISLAVSIWSKNLVFLMVCLSVCVTVFAIHRIPLLRILIALKGLMLILIFMTLYLGFTRSIYSALTSSTSLLLLILCSVLLTATTPVATMLTSMQKVIKKIPVLKKHSERISLALALFFRNLGVLAEIAQQTHQAAKARGLDKKAKAYLIPFTLQSVHHAHKVADALAARGLD